MLTKLLPDQVSKFWPVIKYAVEESLPPLVSDHPDKMNRILGSALAGRLDVWASYNKADKIKFEGIVVTSFIYDDSSGTKSLLIYCLYGYEDVESASWEEGIEAIAKYAKANKCSRAVAYTSSPYIIKLARRLGANADYTFLSFNL